MQGLFFIQHVKNFSLGSSGCFDGDFLILDDPQECSHEPAKIAGNLPVSNLPVMEKNILAWGHPGGASKSHLRFSGQVAEARSVEARTVDACPGARTRIHAECIACFSFL